MTCLRKSMREQTRVLFPPSHSLAGCVTTEGADGVWTVEAGAQQPNTVTQQDNVLDVRRVHPQTHYFTPNGRIGNDSHYMYEELRSTPTCTVCAPVAHTWAAPLHSSRCWDTPPAVCPTA